MSALDVQPIAVSPDDAATLLGVSRATIYNLRRRGHLRIVKVGRSSKVPYADLERIMADGCGEPTVTPRSPGRPRKAG